MVDIDNIRIEIGQRVAVQVLCYKELRIMHVVGLTPCRVAVADTPEANPKMSRKVDPHRLVVLIDQRTYTKDK